MTLARLYLSGSVRRYHANPAMVRLGQTNADHQGRCVQLLLALHPAPAVDLIRAVAVHDVGEMVVGDLPGPFKQAAPRLAAHHAMNETQARIDIAGPEPTLTEADRLWLVLVDRLEALCFVLAEAQGEAARSGSGWDGAELGVLTQAGALGVRNEVRGLIHDLRGGRW